MTEVATTTIVHPITGEVVSLTASTDRLAAFLAEVRRWEEERLKPAKADVSRVLRDEMDRRGKWTLEVGDYKISSSSPTTTEWDVDALELELRDLVRRGVIGQEALDGALEEVTTVKVKPAGVNALKALGGEAEAAVLAHAKRVPKPEAKRGVRVEQIR